MKPFFNSQSNLTLLRFDRWSREQWLWERDLYQFTVFLIYQFYFSELCECDFHK